MDWLCNRTFLLVFTVGAVIRSTIQDSKAEPVVPATVEVCSGSNATINCTFTADSEDLKIKWHFNSLSSESKIDDNNKHYGLKHGKTWSALTIKEVTLNDSGLYFCVVTKDIPILQKYYNSSQLKVYDSHTTSSPELNATATATVCAATTTGSPSSSDWLVWTGTTLGGVAFVIAIVIIWHVIRRRKESPIYENTNIRVQKDRSPRPGMPVEKGKTFQQTNTRRSHNYTSQPRGRKMMV